MTDSPVWTDQELLDRLAQGASSAVALTKLREAVRSTIVMLSTSATVDFENPSPDSSEAVALHKALKAFISRATPAAAFLNEISRLQVGWTSTADLYTSRKPEDLAFVHALRHCAHEIQKACREAPQPAPSEAEIVLDWLNAGGWQLTRAVEDDEMADEYQNAHRWVVSRTAAPYCDDDGVRGWSGPTAFAAMEAGRKAIAPKKQPLAAQAPP